MPGDGAVTTRPRMIRGRAPFILQEIAGMSATELTVLAGVHLAVKEHQDALHSHGIRVAPLPLVYQKVNELMKMSKKEIDSYLRGLSRRDIVHYTPKPRGKKAGVRVELDQEFTVLAFAVAEIAVWSLDHSVVGN